MFVDYFFLISRGVDFKRDTLNLTFLLLNIFQVLKVLIKKIARRLLMVDTSEVFFFSKQFGKTNSSF